MRTLPYTILEKYALAWQCSCSRERVEKALITLGREELANLAAQEEAATITCEFCRQEYISQLPKVLADYLADNFF